MLKIKIDYSSIRNEIAVIKNEAFQALEGDDRKRRDALGRVVEKLKTLQARLDADSAQIEVN